MCLMTFTYIQPKKPNQPTQKNNKKKKKKSKPQNLEKLQIFPFAENCKRKGFSFCFSPFQNKGNIKSVVENNRKKFKKFSG